MNNAQQVPVPADLQCGPETAQLVLDQITTYPETHSQQYWMCGSQACVAGWAVMFHPELWETILPWGTAFTKVAAGGGHILQAPYFTWETMGARALGLSIGDARRLFWHGNTRDMLIGALKSLANNEPVDWAPFKEARRGEEE